MLKNFKLSEESLAKFSHLEASIAHWSHEHTVLSLKARKTLEGIDNLFQARQNVINDFLKTQEIDPKNVESVNVSPNGELVVVMKEPVPSDIPTDAPSNSAL